MNPPPTGGHILSLPIEDPAPVIVDPPPTGPLGRLGGGAWMAGLLRLQVSRVRDGGCARNPSPLPAACSSPPAPTWLPTLQAVLGTAGELSSSWC